MRSGGSTDGDRPSVERWLAERMERVPGEFRSWLGVDGSGGESGDASGGSGEDAGDAGDAEIRSVGRALEDRGLHALRRAMSAPGRNRESAFHLLAADAHLTWSAEALAESSDPESELRDLVRRVAAAGP